MSHSLCVCALSWHLTLSGGKILFSQGWNIFPCHSIVPDGNELTYELSIIHQTQQPQYLTVVLHGFYLLFSPPHAVASWCVDVAITGNDRDHCSKASNSFSSPGIGADQCESSSSALNTWAWGGERKVIQHCFIISWNYIRCVFLQSVQLKTDGEGRALCWGLNQENRSAHSVHKGIYMESTNLFYIYIVDMQVLFI